MGKRRDNSTPGLRWYAINGGLLLLVVWSAVAVVDVSHRCRVLFAALQDLQSEQWTQQERFGQLLLEESTWATYHRVEQVAGKRLGMRVPAPGETRLVGRYAP